ncbi:hypothetical protein SAMN02745229_03163 [Butyrivibrio fibrisolvens DSM 3071]|uniref:Uncharacterized protein n=1 Tax=Butyrivibrio fibrisolvens DSM 3071 TaxID=1121131 RepID=A0A1M6BJ35_BUTFI|nr:hypothetical protein [Butyrivibrio fibrisolvens]SHI48598.1 hypothetical protein SAMN02745229_03163 [Butyrivibrio fibrisolvens DSM 3071]
MKSKIISRLILIAIIACAVYFSYPKIRQYIWNNQHPLDVTYEYDGQEISVRKLFEASNENVHYASHLNISGKYSYSRSKDLVSTVNLGDKKEYFDMGTSSSSSSTSYEYKRLYIDKDNYLWTISGSNSDSERTDYSLALFDDLSTSSSSSFKYYKGMLDGQEYTASEYSDGSKSGLYINVEKILAPDLNNMKDTTVYFYGTPDASGRFKVTFTGEKLYCISEAFGEGSTSSNGFTEIIYSFDAKTKNLLSVSLNGNSEHETYNGTSKESKTLDFIITNISFDACDSIELPNIVCENSQLNGALSGDILIQPSPMLNTEMSYDSDVSDTITSIWEDAIDAFPDGACTISDLSSSLLDNAKELGLDLITDGYVVNEQENGVLIKFSISRDEAVLGSIVMPIVVSDEALSNDNNLLISIYDQVTVDNRGSIRVYHTISDSLTSVTCYKVNNGSFNFSYSILKEAKISNLQNDKELALFAGADSENLKTFAGDYKQAEYASIEKYVIEEKGDVYGYYVIEDESHPDEYGTIYELPFKSKDAVEEKTGDNRNDTVVEWIKFDE